MNISIVILAAGKGTRMRSKLPKVLQPLAGQPLLEHVVATAESLNPKSICVVYGHGGETVQEHFAGRDVEWALQEPQLGTGHAVQQAMPHLNDDEVVVILYGDVPLVQADTMSAPSTAVSGLSKASTSTSSFSVISAAYASRFFLVGLNTFTLRMSRTEQNAWRYVRAIPPEPICARIFADPR